MMNRLVGRSALPRWAISGAVVLCAHAGGGAVVAGWSNPAAVSDRAGGAVILDLAPIDSGPMVARQDTAPGPAQQQSEASPSSVMEKSSDQPAPKAEAEAPPAPEKTSSRADDRRDLIEPAAVTDPVVTLPAPAIAPRVAALHESPASVPSDAVPTTSAPRPASQRGETSAAPMQGQPALEFAALTTWKGRIVAILERNKRYPAEARSRRETGVAKVMVRLDRSGRVVASRISNGSGFALLDQEALALTRRAQPYPALPKGVAGETIDLIVPIDFNIR